MEGVNAVAPRLIAGTVLSAAGQPVAQARVFVLASPGSLPDVALLTDADGRFTLSAPRPGSYEIGASTDGLGSGRTVVMVGPGDARVQIRLSG